MPTARDVLNKAADYMEANGHCKNRYGGLISGVDDDRRCCLYGAVYSAAAELFDVPRLAGRIDVHSALNLDVVRHAEECLAEEKSAEGIVPGLVAWNDAHDRTKEDVVGFLRAAASRCKSDV